VLLTFNDRLSLPSQRKFLDSGLMVAPCTIARTGIMYYKASECGDLFASRDPDSIVKVMTRDEELFAKDSIDSYFSAPITIGHPEEDVTVANGKELKKGHLNGVPFADGQQLSGTLVIDSPDALALVGSGSSELSSGHTCGLKLADSNVDWDAEKTNIRVNHIAIVSKGRAGSARIADEELPMELKEVQAKLSDANLVLEDNKNKIQKLEDEKAELTLKVKEAEAKIVDEDAIEKLIEGRVQFVAQVAKLTDLDVTGLKIDDAKKAVVEKVIEVDLSDASPEYVAVRFDILLEDSLKAKPESKMTAELEKQAQMKDEQEVSPAVTARDKMIERNSK